MTNTPYNNNGIKTYRHEFGKEFMTMLSSFSKIHQYDDRHTYKSEWAKWRQQENITEAIDIEKRRLQENGYVGDIDDKMFKAGRYYFRKKTFLLSSSAAVPPATPTAAEEATDDDDDNHHPPQKQQQQGQRRPYITMSKDAIRLMDDHITNMHNLAAAAGAVFKPSLCYDNFYQTKMSSAEMTKEIETIIEKYEKGASSISPDDLTNEIIDKIKKTYKNRYYKFASKQNA
jgi:hypothetical protein